MRTTRPARELLAAETGVIVNTMKVSNETKVPLPVHDYGQAVQRAVSWLGERYLLAEPQARRKDLGPIYVRVPEVRRAVKLRGATRH